MNSLIVLLLDDSSSMRQMRSGGSSYQGPTIAGFNEFLSMMQLRRDDCELYFAMFSGRHNFRPYAYPNFISVYEMPKLDTNTYRCQGTYTAIYDAICQAIDDVDEHIKGLPLEERPINVTFVAQTDGDDNDSRRTAEAARNRIARHPNWQFIFLGIGGDAQATAKSLGFKPQATIMYDDATAEQAFSQTADAILEALMQGE